MFIVHYHRIYNYESWFIIYEEIYMHVWCDYDIYIYSTLDVPKYPFSKSGVPVPVPNFPGNLGLNLLNINVANTCNFEIFLKVEVIHSIIEYT